jgi:hypothetical protein
VTLATSSVAVPTIPVQTRDVSGGLARDCDMAEQAAEILAKRYVLLGGGTPAPNALQRVPPALLGQETACDLGRAASTYVGVEADTARPGPTALGSTCDYDDPATVLHIMLTSGTRRAARAGKQDARQHPEREHHEQHGLVHVGLVPDGLDLTGWHVMGPGDDLDDAAFARPDEVLLGTGGCPVADRCADCGGTSGLHAVTAAFSKPSGFDVACATLCTACDNGESFMYRLGPAGLKRAFTRHAAHQA